MKKILSLLLSIFLLTSVLSFSLANANKPLALVDYTLTVTKIGSGSGTVTSNPLGINCGTTCSWNFPEENVVNLTATPDPGSVFVGWSSSDPGFNCPGTSTCSITMDANKTVTATFNTATTQYALDVTGDSLSNNLLVIATPKDYDDEIELTLENTGTSTLTFPSIDPIKVFGDGVFGDFEDEDGDLITFDFSNLPSTITPGSTHTVTLTFDVDKDVEVESYPLDDDGKIVITANELTKEVNLEVEVTPEDVCEDGRRSNGDRIASNDGNVNLKVTDISDVDPDDEFGPGEIIEIKNIEVTNDGDDDVNDVIVEAILYNLDKDEIIARAESNSENVDQDENVDFDDFDLEVPSSHDDLDEDDTYILYIQAFEDGNEDENCNYDFIDGMEFQRENDDVDIISTSVTPSTVMCNENANFVVTVQNVGTDDQDIVTVELLDDSLELDFESDQFSLEEFDEDDTQVITHTYKIPATAEEGTYNVEAIVNFDNGKETDSEFITLNVECGEAPVTGEGNVQISLVQSTVTATQGKLFGVPFKLTNLADEVQTYTIDVVVNGNWADSPQDQTVTLQANQETTLYTYLTPKADLTSGSYTLTINAKQDDNIVDSQTATVQIGQVGTTPTGGAVFEPSVTFESIWSNLANSAAFWIIAIIIVFALVVYILTILLRPR